MDEEEFRRLLNLFPVVRSRNYSAEDEAGSKNTSEPSERDKVVFGNNQIMDWQDAWDKPDAEENAVERSEQEDPFWMHLRSSVEQKMGKENAKQFVKAFQNVHKQLVHRAIPLDAVRQITTRFDPNAN